MTNPTAAEFQTCFGASLPAIDQSAWERIPQKPLCIAMVAPVLKKKRLTQGHLEPAWWRFPEMRYPTHSGFAFRIRQRRHRSLRDRRLKCLGYNCTSGCYCGVVWTLFGCQKLKRLVDLKLLVPNSTDHVNVWAASLLYSVLFQGRGVFFCLRWRMRYHNWDSHFEL